MNSDVIFRDYSMFVGKKQDDDWFEWCVFVDGDQELLDRIEAVEYTLHPSFPEPIRRIKDRWNHFALFSSGWGGFTIGIDVEWRDGLHTRTKYTLNLGNDKWPRIMNPGEFESVDAQRVYEALFHKEFRWRKRETVARITGLTEARVLEILAQLANRELVRKAGFLSFEKKELWAPTAVVGVSPRYKMQIA